MRYPYSSFGYLTNVIKLLPKKQQKNGGVPILINHYMV